MTAFLGIAAPTAAVGCCRRVGCERCSPSPQHFHGLALALYARDGRVSSDAAFGELAERHQAGASFQIAEMYAFRGEADEAFEWLERAYAQRDPALSWLKGDQLLKSIDAQVQHVLRREESP